MPAGEGNLNDDNPEQSSYVIALHVSMARLVKRWIMGIVLIILVAGVAGGQPNAEKIRKGATLQIDQCGGLWRSWMCWFAGVSWGMESCDGFDR